METINITFCLDSNYVMPCCVMLNSIIQNNVSESIRFYAIVDSSITEIERNIIQCVLSRCVNKQIDFIYISNILLEIIPYPKNKKYTKSVYYRLFFQDLLPNIDKVLFLDCDMIIRHSLLELYSTDIEGSPLAAVPDMNAGNEEFYKRLGYPAQLSYFNAGLLLINLKYWRIIDAKMLFLSFIRDNEEKIMQNDQDVLNYVFRGQWRVLSIKYNLQNGFLLKRNAYFDRNNYPDWKGAVKDPTIIHFTESIKPWNKRCPNPYKKEFSYYKKGTSWANYSLREKVKGVRNLFSSYLRYFFRSILFNPYYNIKSVLSD